MPHTIEKPLTEEQKANLREWVDALESGQYKQAQGTLRALLNGDYGFCCLGVRCELVSRKHENTEEIGWDDQTFLTWVDGEPIALDGDLGSTRYDLGIDLDEEKCYISMNDDEEASFEEIAAEVRLRHPDVFPPASSTA